MRRTLVGASCAVAALATLGAPAAWAGKKPVPKTAFVLHLCAWAAPGAATLELEGGCHEGRVHLKTVHTPLGSATTTVYTAKRGKATLELVPQHTLSVTVFHLTGSPAAVAFLKKEARAKVISEGLPVASAKTVVASWSGDTSSCKNPPTGDCTQSNMEALKGSWEVLVGVDGAPPGSPGAAEEVAEDDEPQDRAQEELLKPATVGIGLAVIGKV